MIVFRCLAWDKGSAANARGGALWFPRKFQGDGRHDNPTLYGCLYVSAEPVSAVAEQFDRLTGTSIEAPDLLRRGSPLALAAITLPDDAPIVDLDEPGVLEREGLRPSRVATHERAITQAGAAGVFGRNPAAIGLRWWSTLEALWANVTLFDRAETLLAVEDVQPLELGDDVVVQAAEFLGLSIST